MIDFQEKLKQSKITDKRQAIATDCIKYENVTYSTI